MRFRSSIKSICCSIVSFTNNGLIFLRRSGAVVCRFSSKQVLLKFSKISKENTCVGVFLNKVTGLQTCNFIKKRLQHKCFRVKFPKFLITSFLQKTSGSCFWELVYITTQNFLREVWFYGVVGIIHGGPYFRGFIAFEKLRNIRLDSKLLKLLK